MQEIQNTLLLILVIRLYQLGKKIPLTRNKIIEEIISGIESWENNKFTRHKTRISWKVKKDLLENTAFMIKESASVSLSEDELDSFLVKAIDKYEKTRDIPIGLEKATILKELSSTGFIYHDDFGITFQNILFLDHFASLRLAKLYTKDKGVLKNKLNQMIWHNVIIATASKLDDATIFIDEIYQADLFKAAACLIENERVEDDQIIRIVSALKKKCSSRFPIIRRRSLYYLRRIPKKYTEDVFRSLLEFDQIFVKMTAIEELSKKGDSEARKIVNNYLDWDEGGWAIKDTTQGALARALANFEDEKSHLKILDIWRRKMDMFTIEACKNAMLSLVYRNKITSTVRDELIAFFLEKRTSEEISVSWTEKIRDIADIFIALNDESIVPLLIRSFSDTEDSSVSRNSQISRILSSFKSVEVMNTLIEECLNQENPRSKRAGCAKALATSKYFNVELNIFEWLLSDKDPLIRRSAIIGLSKFPDYAVKDSLLLLIDYDYDIIVHIEAIRLLGKLGLISMIYDEKTFPIQVDAKILFEQIRRYKIVEFVPILEKLHNKWVSKNNRNEFEKELIDLAHTYLILGETNIAHKIILSFYVNGEIHFQNKFTYASLADLCPLFGGDLGLEILNEIYNAIRRRRKESASFDSSSYFDNNYIENLERIGNLEAIEILTRLCEEYAGKNRVLFESAMRAIGSLSPKSKEDWLIELINSHPEMRGFDLHRAVEVLGVIGSKKTISFIKEIAQKNIESEYILNICLLAIEYIYRSSGIFRLIDDNDILPL